MEHLLRTRVLTTGQIARLCFEGDENAARAALARLRSNGWINGKAF